MCNKFLIGLSIVIISALACSKEEGTGGEASIKGKVVLKEFDPDFTVLQHEIPDYEEDVYIQYGNNEGVGDRVYTDLNGNFKFEYLRPGDYTIYILSEDSAGADLIKRPKSVKISIDGSKTYTLPTITKYKSIGIENGTSTITGRIWLINYKNNFAEIKDTSLGQELDVYLVYGNHKTFDIRSRTHYDGTYEFPNLIKGKYTVYVYSDDKSGATQQIPVKIENIVITDDSQIVQNKDIYVEKQ